MRTLRICIGMLLLASAALGTLALTLPPARAEPPDYCPQPSGRPAIECRGCPAYVDPVVCTVICAGGPTQKTFSNQCFASCSGYVIVGECARTGG